ncbi:Serine/threonine protein kinase [Streptomyces sp. LamerLS-316]|uniref:serine/threonine-protein kinase n=1 Tax=unclassified Streptomyces TaxID=2593676 RepID=UPI000823B626|nr:MULTISPECIES: serine/threonine-protein kinase [unclassified Streptomyces]MYQ40878.1 tetratricopeptide repeat protein [Streptomyces sp. SID4921]SCK06130.1 Serine/threonine protein kinase [Streptomyces sp. LamerLS-316]
MADTTRLIQSRYRLLDMIGRGGMGEVWRARDESLGRQVAVKCLKPMGPQHDQAFTRILRERFRREARVAAALQHRGVTVVHDFGESDGVLYLVMELLEGRNLSQLLEDNKQHPLPVADVVDIAEQVADALGYTHQQGIVHRDLKPANIMRLDDGAVKICDFGIARLGHDIGFTSRLTGTGIAMGTPHYMSPEQISGGEVDHRSDLYSLGCVLYEIATGVPPFDMDDAWAVLVGHRDTVPEPPRTHRAELPRFFDEVVLDLLAKTPGERPADAGDLRRRITLGRTGGQPEIGRVRLAPPVPVQHPGGRAYRLPSWTRNMTAGHKAGGAADPGTAAIDQATALTGAWTTATGPAPGNGLPPGGSGRPTPSPELLATLASRHSAGLNLGRLGHWEEAGDVHRAVASERARALGADHPDTLASRYEVGFTLSRTGRPEEALREFGRVADGRARTLGPDHPETLAARQETAYVLGQLGRHFEAHQVYAAVLASRERSMGPDHPDTLRCRHNLAFNLSRLGRLEDSYRMAREVADARGRLLGTTHPDTLVTLYEVAYTLGRLDRWTEALSTYREVAQGRAATLGADHPDTLSARYEVGISLGRLGRSAEAMELYRALVADRTRAGGPDHPETLRARHGLGVNLGRMARWEEALDEAREVCAIRERTLGPDHPDTLVSRREVAVGLGWLGRWAEALTDYRTVADIRERVLGADHPDTLASRNDEAHCLEQLGRGTEAVDLYRRVADLRRQSAMPPH